MMRNYTARGRIPINQKSVILRFIENPRCGSKIRDFDRIGTVAPGKYMEYYTYILRSIAKGTLYIGQTDDVEERLSLHNKGHNRSTKSGIPWKLVYSKTFTSRREAIKHERYLKSLKKRIYLEKIINDAG